MAIFGKRWKKAEDETDVRTIDSRLEVFDETSKLTKELMDDMATDVRDFMIREDLIDDEFAEYIPMMKKYAHKLSRLYELTEKACKIEIEKTEILEKRMENIEKSMATLAAATEGQNRILERIAVAMETENITKKK